MGRRPSADGTPHNAVCTPLEQRGITVSASRLVWIGRTTLPMDPCRPMQMQTIPVRSQRCTSIYGGQRSAMCQCMLATLSRASAYVISETVLSISHVCSPLTTSERESKPATSAENLILWTLATTSSSEGSIPRRNPHNGRVHAHAGLLVLMHGAKFRASEGCMTGCFDATPTPGTCASHRLGALPGYNHIVS